MFVVHLTWLCGYVVVVHVMMVVCAVVHVVVYVVMHVVVYGMGPDGGGWLTE